MYVQLGVDVDHSTTYCRFLTSFFFKAQPTSDLMKSYLES